MDRRAFLAAGVAAAVAGCVDSGGGTADEDDERDRRFAEIVEATSDPSPVPDLEVTVDVNAAVETVDGPASVDVAWEHVGEEALTIEDTRDYGLVQVNSASGTARLVSADRFDGPSIRVAFDRCWRKTEPIDETPDLSRATLEPGERYERRSMLFATTEECLSERTYRFETAVRAYPEPEGPIDEEGGEWAVELRVGPAGA